MNVHFVVKRYHQALDLPMYSVQAQLCDFAAVSAESPKLLGKGILEN